MRLISVSDPLAGRVEVCYDGVWGTVCSTGWNYLDASVVCSILGYSASGITYPLIMTCTLTATSYQTKPYSLVL